MKQNYPSKLVVLKGVFWIKRREGKGASWACVPSTRHERERQERPDSSLLVCMLPARLSALLSHLGTWTEHPPDMVHQRTMTSSRLLVLCIPDRKAFGRLTSRHVSAQNPTADRQPHSHPHTGYATSCSTRGPVILALDQDIKAISRSRLAAGRTRSTQTVLVFFELKYSSKGNEGSGEPTDKHKLHGLRRPATSSCPGASYSVFSPPFRPKVQFCGKAGAPPSHVSLGWQE